MAEQVNRRYVIERLLGEGGMAEVFAGRSLGLEGFSRPVAIKKIHSQLSDDRARRAMLIAEARLAARLSHGNIVAVHDLDEDEAGRLFLVMELVHGMDLASLLRTGALPLPIALFVTCEILRGLGHAHDLPASDDAVRGLVHRDVSPQNVLIGWDGSVKVTDFGLAKAFATANASASLLVKGKPGYVSPEQANGEDLDGRSDLFSVGVMLWEMICGERLFGRGSLEATLRGLLLEPVPSPRSRAPGTPADIERIAMRLLERDRGRRYPTADAAIEALLACAAYPKDGRGLVSALLVERSPARAPRRSAGGARLDEPPGSSFDEETTLAPPIAPLLVPGEPYPDPPPLGRARRVVLLASFAVAMAVVTILVLRSVLRGADDAARGVPAARVAPPSEPRMNPQPPPQQPQPQPQQSQGEAHAITMTSAPLQPSPAPAAPARPAPTPGPPPLPMAAPVGRAPSRSRQAASASSPQPAGGDRMRVIDLRDLAPKPAEHDERREPPR